MIRSSVGSRLAAASLRPIWRPIRSSQDPFRGLDRAVLGLIGPKPRTRLQTQLWGRLEDSVRYLDQGAFHMAAVRLDACARRCIIRLGRGKIR
jgi:hypothetical protein